MPRKIGAYDAKTRLPELLRDVERGERITITLRGRPVAELVPPRGGASDAARAVASMRAFEPIKGVDSATLQQWVEEGRR